MNLLKFSEIIGKLKTLKRTGWVRNKIIDAESVAEHSYRVAILAMILAPEIGADQSKAIKMALTHDVGEAEVGDLVTVRGYETVSSSQEKHVLEQNAIHKIFSLVNGKEYEDLFQEFEDAKTIEAKLIKELDKLEMAIQALEYEKRHKINLQEFIDNAQDSIHSDLINGIMKEINKSRSK